MVADQRVSDGAARRLAWAALVLSVIGVLTGIGLEAGLLQRTSVFGMLGKLTFLAFAVAGMLIARRQPRNRIAWILLAVGAAVGVGEASEPYAEYGLNHGAGLPAAAYVAAISGGLWVPAIGLLGTLLVLLFPDGRLPSPRWRPLARLSGATIALVYLMFTLAPGPLELYQSAVANPLGLGLLEPALKWLFFALPILPLCMLGCAAALVVRFRRSTGVERLQLKWLAAAGTVVMSSYLALTILSLPYDRGGGAGTPPWLDVLQTAVVYLFVLIRFSIAVAVLRYGLYGLDRLISRTLSYVVISGTLLLTYLAGVTTVSRLTPNDSSIAVAASTLAVAALFQPLRRRVQARVDRRFNRARYDADRTVDAFTRRLRDEVDLDAVRADLLQVVHGTLQPTSAGLWLRSTAERTT